MAGQGPKAGQKVIPRSVRRKGKHVTDARASSAVMPGLVPGIHVLLLLTFREQDVDGRDKPGHDDVGAACESNIDRIHCRWLHFAGPCAGLARWLCVSPRYRSL